MSNLNSCKGKHLTIENRLFIELALDENYTLKEVAERLGKNPTNISKEVKRNRVMSSTKKTPNCFAVKIIRIAVKSSCVGNHAASYARNAL
jgi:IS30 family transposase